MKSIAWICVDFGSSSGGHRTVFQNVNYLAENGYKCDLYIDGAKETSEKLKERIERDYFKIKADVYPGKTLTKKYDIVIATYYDTAKYVSGLDVKYKMYFIQDYEPWFFPMSESYLMARESYNYGLCGVSIGRWLVRKLEHDLDARVTHFSFCADLNIYKRNEETKKEDAICFIYQPDKPRRCAKMGLKALQIIQKERPDIKIYLFGSPKATPYNINVEHLGLLSVEECNELYNKCKVGICMSSSNPSRVPFEMMAAGLPVVDLYLKNNLYDLPEQGCLLAEPSAESIASAVLQIIDNDALQERMSKNGEKYMQDYPLERGFEEFKKVVDKCVSGNFKKEKMPEIIYHKGPVRDCGVETEVGPEVYFKSKDEIEAERLEAERIKKEKEWRENLTVPQKIYLKIRYKLLGR